MTDQALPPDPHIPPDSQAPDSQAAHAATDPHDVVTELVGVYNADAGLVGEARYVVGSWFGKAHCALCDVTHSPFRRKKQWDTMVRDLAVPFSLDHLNDMPRDVGQLVAQHGAPLVAARLANGGIRVLLTPGDLEPLEGSVTGFEGLLRTTLANERLHLAHPYRTPPAGADPR